MQGQQRDKGRLAHLELAAIDLSITALEAAGYTLDHAASTSGNPHEMMAEAVAAMHKPFTELIERDREIIEQIRTLAGQLSLRTSLRELLNARGKIVQGR